MGGEAISTILTIAGHDPSSGAGITADLAVFAAHGFFGTSALSALTVQSTLGVRAVYPVEQGILAETLDFLAEDLSPAGIKIGMLASEENVQTVAEFVRRMRGEGWEGPVVLDPVIRSSSGRELLSAAAVALLREGLLPVVDWVTPNLAELGELTGALVESEQEMEAAATELCLAYRTLNVVATGGHLESADDLVVLAEGRKEWLRGEKLESRATHGTGCAFSSALLCGLVDGLQGKEAAGRAKQFVAEAIRRAVGMGGGCGPMNLLWPLR